MIKKDDDKKAATKGDLKMLEQKIFDRMKTEVVHDIKGHFDLAIETIRYDLLGANKDDIEVVKDRVRRLEVHTGLRR